MNNIVIVFSTDLDGDLFRIIHRRVKMMMRWSQQTSLSGE